MSTLRHHRWTLVVAALAVFTLVTNRNFGLLTPGAIAQESANELSPNAASIAHGKYLVHHVAKCIECHTPRDARGVLIETRLLRGAPIPVKGPKYSEPWASQSVSLAGLGNYEEAFVRYLLTHGVRADGSKPESPMPSFQLSNDDANAVIAYLKSLPPS